MAEKKLNESSTEDAIKELQRQLLETQLANEQLKLNSFNEDADLKSLQQEELREQLLARKKQKEETLKMQKENALAAEKERKDLIRAQDSCPHTKPDGKTYLAGQRDHQGNIMLICQCCQKLFVNDEIPRHLMPVANRIGGPNDIAPEPWSTGRRGKHPAELATV